MLTVASSKMEGLWVFLLSLPQISGPFGARWSKVFLIQEVSNGFDVILSYLLYIFHNSSYSSLNLDIRQMLPSGK